MCCDGRRRAPQNTGKCNTLDKPSHLRGASVQKSAAGVRFAIVRQKIDLRDSLSSHSQRDRLTFRSLRCIRWTCWNYWPQLLCWLSLRCWMLLRWCLENQLMEVRRVKTSSQFTFMLLSETTYIAYDAYISVVHALPGKWTHGISLQQWFS